MTRDFEKLVQDTENERERLESETYNQPVVYARELFEKLDQYFISELTLQRWYAEDVQGDRREEEAQEAIFTQLQKLRRHREKIHSNHIPIELYHFLQEIVETLQPTNSLYVFATGLRVKRTRLDSLFYFTGENLDKFSDDPGQVSHEDIEGINQDPVMITLPRNELQNPFTYCLIPHEVFHGMEIAEQMKRKFNYTPEPISDSKKKELAIDALTLNYIGPAYALALIELYDRIKDVSIETHPDVEARRQYLLQYIQHVKDNLQTNSIYHKSCETIESKISRERSDKKSYEITNFESFNSEAVSILADKNIPTFLERQNELKDSLQISGIEYGRLNHDIQTLLGNNKDENSQPVAIPVHPILLLNLLVPLSDVSESVDLQTCTLSSFRKWYARKRYAPNHSDEN